MAVVVTTIEEGRRPAAAEPRSSFSSRTSLTSLPRRTRVKDIVKKYSAFVQFPVSLNGEKGQHCRCNLAKRSKAEIKDEEYEEFYKFQANDYEAPLMRLHFQC